MSSKNYEENAYILLVDLLVIKCFVFKEKLGLWWGDTHIKDLPTFCGKWLWPPFGFANHLHKNCVFSYSRSSR